MKHFTIYDRVDINTVKAVAHVSKMPTCMIDQRWFSSTAFSVVLFSVPSICSAITASVCQNMPRGQRPRSNVKSSKLLPVLSQQICPSSPVNFRSVVFEMHATTFLLPWPWPWTHDLETKQWSKYSEDVSASRQLRSQWYCFQCLAYAQQSLLQFVKVMHLHQVNSLLDDIPLFVADQTEVRAVRQLQLRSNERGVACLKSRTVWYAPCAECC